MSFNEIEVALAAIAKGGFVVVADDASRENEGDLIIAAETLTRQALSFMLRYTSGVICVAITEERADELMLPLMVPENSESQRTAFTVSVDLRHGTTTGISAAPRSVRWAGRRWTHRAFSARVTCFRCVPAPVASSNAVDTPKLRSIWLG
jgi:3,4-dihydroxy-2-butanone 4-phosphate synthase